MQGTHPEHKKTNKMKPKIAQTQSRPYKTIVVIKRQPQTSVSKKSLHLMDGWALSEPQSLVRRGMSMLHGTAY